jgi:hypothetical protein
MPPADMPEGQPMDVVVPHALPLYRLRSTQLAAPEMKASAVMYMVLTSEKPTCTREPPETVSTTVGVVVVVGKVAKVTTVVEDTTHSLPPYMVLHRELSELMTGLLLVTPGRM